MKSMHFALALSVSLLSTNVFAVDKKSAEDKKDFGRKHLIISTVPATAKLIDAVISNVDKKYLQGDPKVQIVTNRKALKRICLGMDARYPDIVVTTREMNEEEFKRCQNNVNSVIKLKMGHEALVVASAKNSLDLELDPRKLFMALARDVPRPNMKRTGVLMPNPYKTWKDIDEKAPKQAIKFYGPAENSRDERSVKELGMESGCRTWDWVADMKHIQTNYRLYRELCHKPRKDGVYNRADKDMTKKLLSDKNSIGLMGFNDWVKSKDKLKAYPINEMPPTVGTINKGLYPLSRTYYVYLKASGLENVQALSHVMNELVNEKTLASDGYLAEMGMVAMPKGEIKREVSQALEFSTMEPPQAQ